MTTDHKIAYTVGVVYVTLCFAQLPLSAALQLSALGVATMAGAGWVAALLGERSTPAVSIFLVSLAASALLAVPQFPAMGGQHRAAVPLGFFGAVSTALVWVTHRWPALNQRTRTASLGQAVGVALAFATILSLVATIPIAYAWLSGNAGPGLAWIYPAYFGGALAAAVLYRLVRRVQYLASGRYLIGALCGFCLYAAVMPVVAVLEREPLGWTMMVSAGMVAGVMVGPPVAFGVFDAE